MSSKLNAALLILRLALGVTMLAHGLQKFLATGVAGVQGMLSGLGIPLAEVFGVVLPLVEVVAGLLVIAGLFTRVSAVLLTIVSLGAMFTVHFSSGFFSTEGGYEYVLVLALLGLALALTGAGRWSIDALVKRPRASESHTRTGTPQTA